MRFKLVYLALGLFLVLLAAGTLAKAWPVTKPTGYVELRSKGEPTLLCAEWKMGALSVVANCPVLGTPYLSWPPAGVKPTRMWPLTLKAGKTTCRQWDALRGGRFAGLVFMCAPQKVSSALVA